MTNQQIIDDIAVKLYGYDRVCEMVENGEDIPLHSALGWRMRGTYRIKEGAIGIETKLWKKRTVAPESESGEADAKSQFYLQKTILYGEDEVELVEDCNNQSNTVKIVSR